MTVSFELQLGSTLGYCIGKEDTNLFSFLNNCGYYGVLILSSAKEHQYKIHSPLRLRFSVWLHKLISNVLKALTFQMP